jgi:hypothetical protein
MHKTILAVIVLSVTACAQHSSAGWGSRPASAPRETGCALLGGDGRPVASGGGASARCGGGLVPQTGD